MNSIEGTEMYLETIYRMSLESAELHKIDLSKEMGYSRPTITIKLKKLQDAKYIAIDKDNHIKLLPKGKTIAKKIYDRHQVLTKVLIKIGVNNKIAAKDACLMEHDLSDETFNAIKKYFKL